MNEIYFYREIMNNQYVHIDFFSSMQKAIDYSITRQFPEGKKYNADTNYEARLSYKHCYINRAEVK